MNDARARAATKMGIMAATRTDWLSAAMTPRKRYNVKRKKATAPGCSPIAQYLVTQNMIKKKCAEMHIVTHEISENNNVQAKRNGTTAIVLAKT